MAAMSTHDMARLVALAAEQEGVVARSQALDAGVTDRRLALLRSAGALESVGSGLLRIPGREGWLQDQWVAHLAAGDGVRASHGAAARLLEIEGFDSWPPEVTIPHRQRVRLPGVVVHRSTDLAGERRVRRHGLWATNATRTLIDLGAVVSEAQLEVALDDALRRGLTTYDRLWTAIARLGRPGRSGVPQLRDLLVSRGDVDGLTETGFETLLLRALREHGLPRPTTQFELFDDDGVFVMRFDAAYVPEKVGVEADSKRWHGTDSRFESDREQRARAGALGWTVVPVTHRQVTTRPTWVGETVGRTLVIAMRRSAA
jgi:hypothetical protein